MDLIEKIQSKADELLAKSEVLLSDLDNIIIPADTRETIVVRRADPISPAKTRTEKTYGQARFPTGFLRKYEQWYTASLALIECNLPTRLQELKDLYTKTSKSFESDYIYNFNRPTIANSIRRMEGIVSSIPPYLESKLYDMKIMIAQSFIEDDLSSADYKLEAGDIRGAGVIAGIVLERHLKYLCDSAEPKIKYNKADGISKLNDRLKKAGVYDLTQWREIQVMLDIRNTCAHDDEEYPNKKRVAKLIKDVLKFTKLFSA